MNRNSNTNHSDVLGHQNHKPFFQILKNIFTINGISPFDIFQYSNQYNEKLLIIYANIRVWILDKVESAF